MSVGQAFRSLIRPRTISSRSYYTRSRQNNRVSLYDKISPLGNPNVDVTPELDKWVETGNKVRFGELQRIVLDLRKRKRCTQALQVSEWMQSRDTFEFNPIQHAIQLDLIGVVRGNAQAENYFNTLSDQCKTDKVYGALLHCYARKRDIQKALLHFDTMKEKGLPLSPPAFNNIMTIYFNTGEYQKIPEILNEMTLSGVRPDNLSHRLRINSHAARSDVGGLEAALGEMESDSAVVTDWKTYAAVANFYIKAGLEGKADRALRKAEARTDSENGPAAAYNNLISLHARLGNKDDVLRLWRRQKEACKRYLNQDYTNMLESLVKLGEFDEAEKVLGEWESSGNCFDLRVPKVVILGYIKKGLYEKAEVLLSRLNGTGKGSMAEMWGRVVEGYLEKGDVENAADTLEMSRSVHDSSSYGRLEKMIEDYRARKQ